MHGSLSRAVSDQGSGLRVLNPLSCRAARTSQIRRSRSLLFIIFCVHRRKIARVKYAKGLLARRKFSHFAYTDGTTFYLARSAPEKEEKKRQALGPFVWRMANGKDAVPCVVYFPGRFCLRAERFATTSRAAR